MVHEQLTGDKATSTSLPHGSHLVGSIPLGTTEDVFRDTSAIMGDRLTRLPDGETGERYNWIVWQYPFLAQNPYFEEVPANLQRYGQLPRVKLRPDVSPEEAHIDDLGYAKAAKESYKLFAQMKKEGTIPASYRFQVSLPTPLATVATFVEPEDQGKIDPIYTVALLAELNDILATVPHDELAIQWDVATEFLLLEKAGGPGYTYFLKEQTEILPRLIELGKQVPAQVEVGYHLCYGDAGHKHFVEPKDTTLLVEVANGIAAGLERDLNWIHMPVPRNRTDEEYYQPLRNLKLHPETRLYLGLVHFEPGDQVEEALEEAKQKIGVAQRMVSHFGIATECGMGRRTKETVLTLLHMHHELTAAE
ncbi:hypothetical protein [Ktedonospora formicarum]|uniref:Methionine synthase n=1 Tax=Ktedonospora formicarum TaxID=2778364 RepID=A0A8J3MXC9_9CHLR|nr:hypothetical protein [Ktedonospora formicarum]GHO49618.1 hypothetical protein KSX_77810 [Ktedonospora formicarum]